MGLSMEDVTGPPLDIFDKFPFGKYRGLWVETILDNDPRHLLWLMRAQAITLTDAVKDEIERIYNVPIRRD